MMMMLMRMKMMKLWILLRQLKHGPKIQMMNIISPIMTMRVWQRSLQELCIFCVI